MPQKEPSETRCLGPGCRSTITRKPGSGRPRLYCSDACGARYRKANPRVNDTADTAAALARHAALLEEASTTGDVDRALRLYAECNQIMKELLKAVVVLCRTKMKTSEVASALHVSVDTVNRHVLAARERATASAPPVVPPPRSRHPERAPRRPLRPAGGTGSADGGPRAGQASSSPARCPSSSAPARRTTKNSRPKRVSIPRTSPASSAASVSPHGA